MPKLTVDGLELEVPAGATILHACKLAGKERPRFCDHERLSIAGNYFALFIAAVCGLIAASQPAFAKPDYSKKQIDAISDGFADCVVASRPRQARDFVGNNLPGAVVLKRYGSLADSDCLLKATKPAGGIAMTFPDPSFRYALARALVRFDYPTNSFENFKAVPLLSNQYFSPLIEADLPKNKRKADAIRARYESAAFTASMARFSECVVRANPSFAQALIVSKLASPARNAAIAQIKPTLGLCLSDGTIKFDTFNLTGALAVSYYRLAYQVRPPAGKVGQGRGKS